MIKKKSILIAAVTAVITALASIVTGGFGYLNEDRGHDIQMVQIALSILSGDHEDTSLPGRRFALRALEKYSEVEIPQSEFEEWAKTGTLPNDIPFFMPNVTYGKFLDSGGKISRPGVILPEQLGPDVAR